MEVLNMNQSVAELLEVVGLNEEFTNESLRNLGDADSRYVKDLKLNFKTILKGDKLNQKEVALMGLALAANAANNPLQRFFRKLAEENEATMAEIGEAVACASLLSSNNVLYRFRHFVEKEKYGQIPARLRMNIMMTPVLGKEFFELISTAVSAVNGCQMCVASHENHLIELGTTEERIFESIRMASVIASMVKVIY